MRETKGAALRIESVRKEYPGGVVAVDNVSLSIESGEFLTLLGPSGSGKTTLLMMIAGFTTPSAGEIWIEDNPVSRVAPQHRGLGMVFQNYALFPHMTVAENIAFPLEMRRRTKPEIRTNVTAALEAVRLSGYEDRFPKQLSGGQQQRVALARAIVFEPPVLLMDEPLGALDKRLREEMQLEIVQIKDRLNVTVIYVTHDQEEALTMSDRIAVMRQGRIEQIGTPFQLYEEPQNAFIADFIGESNFLSGIVSQIVAGSMVKVNLEQGPGITVETEQPVAVGDRLELAIRPERILIMAGAGGEDGWNRLTGRIEDVIYVGDATKYRVVMGSMFLIVKSQHHNDHGMHQRGAEVTIGWRPSDARIVARSTGEGERIGV